MFFTNGTPYIPFRNAQKVYTQMMRVTTRALDLGSQRFLAVMLFRSSLLLTVLFRCLTGFETQIRTSTVSSNSPLIVRRLPTLDSALRHFDTLRTDEIKHSSIDPSRRRMEVSILGRYKNIQVSWKIHSNSFRCRNFSLHLSNDNNLLAPTFRAVVSDETDSKSLRKSTEKSFTLERVG